MESCNLLFLILLSTKVSSKTFYTESCGSWKSVDKTRTRNSEFQPRIYSESTCMLTCMGHPGCDSVDFNAQSGTELLPTCYLHFTSKHPAKTYQDPNGTKHWEFERQTNCHVDCMYAFASVAENKVFGGGTQMHLVSNPWSCRKACIDKSDCIGYDWHDENDRGDQCYLHFAPQETLQPKANAHHYEFTRQNCRHPELVSVEEEPDGSNTKTDFKRTKDGGITTKFWLWRGLSIGTFVLGLLLRCIVFGGALIKACFAFRNEMNEKTKRSQTEEKKSLVGSKQTAEGEVTP